VAREGSIFALKTHHARSSLVTAVSYLCLIYAVIRHSHSESSEPIRIFLAFVSSMRTAEICSNVEVAGYFDGQNGHSAKTRSYVHLLRHIFVSISSGWTRPRPNSHLTFLNTIHLSTHIHPYSHRAPTEIRDSNLHSDLIPPFFHEHHLAL
jgi:hypothetical protein